jgi:hypothetical protein
MTPFCLEEQRRQEAAVAADGSAGRNRGRPYGPAFENAGAGLGAGSDCEINAGSTYRHQYQGTGRDPLSPAKAHPASRAANYGDLIPAAPRLFCARNDQMSVMP